jgi:hypothetical protein
MRTRSRASLALITASLASLALAGAALGAATTLTATLAGSADTAADGTGSAMITLDPATGEACWELTAEGIGAVMQSHIHVGAEGESGDVAVPLDVDGFDGTSEGCVSDQDAATLQAIIDDAAGYYVNLHTADFPGGAIRGQLAAETPDTALPVGGSGSLPMLGALLLISAAALGLRVTRVAATRD